MVGFYATSHVIAANQKLDSIMNEQIASKIKSIGITSQLPADSSADDIVKWLLEFLGGFLSTIVMYFLHRWFPKIFPSGKTSYYKRQSMPAESGKRNSIS